MPFVRLGLLQRFRATLAANAPEVPHLDGPRSRFEARLAETEEVAKQQAAFIASKQESSKRLRALLTDCERMADGIRKFLKENYGVSAEKLAEFGLKPFRGRRKAVKNPDPPDIPDVTKLPVLPSSDKPH